MEKIIFASGNMGKIVEVKALLPDFNVLSLEDIGFTEEIPETGNTFKENSFQKAEFVFKRLGIPVIADDSGLEVDALGGRPGVFSARYAPSADGRILKLIKELEGVVPLKRTARFVCVITFIISEEIIKTFRGICKGEISLSPVGNSGFGYDPVFYLTEYSKTMAEISPELKNRISHRGKALNLLVDEINRTSFRNI